MQIKRYGFSKAINFRDMGGVCTVSNRSVKWNMIFRSDKLEGMTDKEWNTIKESGIKTIIDMRSFDETKISPDSCPEEFNYIHFPLVEDDLSFNNISSPAMQAFAESVAEGYKNIVLSHGENLAGIINIISDSLDDGGVLFHCTSGKDRTGVVASLIYYILGVSDADIVADYQVSYTYNKLKSDKFMSEFPQYNRYRSVVLSEAKNMYALLELYREIDIENYLVSRGAEKSKLEKLKKILLTEPIYK